MLAVPHFPFLFLMKKYTDGEGGRGEGGEKLENGLTGYKDSRVF